MKKDKQTSNKRAIFEWMIVFIAIAILMILETPEKADSILFNLALGVILVVDFALVVGWGVSKIK